MEKASLESVNSVLNTGLMIDSQLIAFSILTCKIKLPLQWLALRVESTAITVVIVHERV